MSNWISAVCQTNNISIYYTRTGGNKPPLILLHGLMTNGACWTEIARELEKDYDVIMPDARGHGNSSIPDFGYRYEDHANDIAGLVGALQLDSSVLLGHSMGGMTAAVAAALKPNLFSAVVLADPSFLSPEVQRAVRDSDVADVHRKMRNLTLDEVIADARKRHPKRSSELIELFSRARLQTSMAAFDVLTPPNPDYKMLLKMTDIPCLVIFGDKGVVSEAMAEELKQLKPDLQTTMIENAGHSLHIDQPERFIAIVKAFLKA